MNNNRLLWLWVFNPSINPKAPVSFNPVIVNKVFKHHSSTLLLTAIRMRGLFLRKTYGKTGRAMAAVMEFGNQLQ